jgi:hypothetical protein
MEHETAFEKPASLGQYKEIMSTLVQAMPAALASEDAQQIIENKGWLISEVEDLFTLRKLLLDDWAQFYREVFDLNVDFSTLKIPRRRPGFTRLIVVAQGVHLERMIEVASKDFPVECSLGWRHYWYSGSTSDRYPSKTYALWVRNRVDPDAEYAGVYPALLKRRNVQGITLDEHLLFHLKYYRETGKFLDRNETSTLCFGSRNSEGHSPQIYVKKTYPDEKCVGIGFSFALSKVSVREVVA